MADRRIVYVVEGEPFVGTIESYAKALVHGHYAGIGVDATVWTVGRNGLEPTLAKVTMSDYDEDDWAYLTVELEFSETATAKIDGRA